MFSVEILTEGIDLTPLQIRAAFRQIGYSQVPTGDMQMPPVGCLKLWVFTLISRLKFLDPEQRTLLAEEMIPELSDLANRVLANEVQTPMVVIADSRYATWHPHTGWLDMANGSSVTAPGHPALETVAFNLAVLFWRNHAACTEIIRRKAHRDGNPSD